MLRGLVFLYDLPQVSHCIAESEGHWMKRRAAWGAVGLAMASAVCGLIVLTIWLTHSIVRDDDSAAVGMASGMLLFLALGCLGQVMGKVLRWADERWR